MIANLEVTKKKRHRFIEHWDDERDIDNSLIVTLVAGRKFNNDTFLNEHVRGFDTVKDAMEGVRNSVVCECDLCLEEMIYK